MKQNEIKVGDVVKYSKPQQGEADFRFTVVEIDEIDGNVDIELICDWAIRPIENVDISEVTKA